VAARAYLATHPGLHPTPTEGGSPATPGG
jgi:hypothetical protein